MKKIFNSGLFRVILAFLIIGIMLIVFGASDFIDSRKTPLNLNEMSATQFEKGVIVEGDIYYNLGVFETIEHQRNGVTESTDYRYVIPVGEESFMGLEAMNSEMVASLDAQTDETYDYLEGKIDDTTTVVHITGKIEKMDDEDFGYFKDFLVDSGYDAKDVDELDLKYYVDAKTFGKASFLLIVGIIFILVDAVIIFFLFKPKKNIAPAPSSTSMGQSFGQQNTQFNQMGQGPQDSQFGQAPQGSQFGQAPQGTQFGQAPQGPQYGQAPQGPQYGQTAQPDPSERKISLGKGGAYNQDVQQNDSNDYYNNNNF